MLNFDLSFLLYAEVWPFCFTAYQTLTFLSCCYRCAPWRTSLEKRLCSLPTARRSSVRTTLIWTTMVRCSFVWRNNNTTLSVCPPIWMKIQENTFLTFCFALWIQYSIFLIKQISEDLYIDIHAVIWHMACTRMHPILWSGFCVSWLMFQSLLICLFVVKSPIDYLHSLLRRPKFEFKVCFFTAMTLNKIQS